MVKGSKPSSKPNTKSSKVQQDTAKTQNVSKKPAAGSSSIVLPSRMTTYTVPPAGWPSTMPYLSTALASTTLTSTQQALLHPPSGTTYPSPGQFTISSLVTYSPTSNPQVHIKSITDPNHPAYPQSGLFAAKALSPGTHIVDYTGQIHACPLPSCATSDYDLAFLDRDASVAIDSALMGNEARYVNDYHGIRDQGPNAMFEEYFVKVKGTKVGNKETWQARMGIFVMPSKSGHGIPKGEEICVSYGKGWWRARRSLMEVDVDNDHEFDEMQLTKALAAVAVSNDEDDDDDDDHHRKQRS